MTHLVHPPDRGTTVRHLMVRDHKSPKGDHEGMYVTGPFDIDKDNLAVL